jgi:hypothetical protein
MPDSELAAQILKARELAKIVDAKTKPRLEALAGSQPTYRAHYIFDHKGTAEIEPSSDL